MMGCPKLRFFTDQNEPKGGPHENEFGLFSNTKMNVINIKVKKVYKKSGVICLISMFPS